MFAAVVRRNAAPAMRQVRQFAGTAETAKAETQKWFKLTVGMIGLSSAAFAYNIATLEHEHSRHDLPYQKIRTKPYPWSCPDCNLFDGECWDVCKGRGSAASHH